MAPRKNTKSAVSEATSQEVVVPTAGRTTRSGRIIKPPTPLKAELKASQRKRAASKASKSEPIKLNDDNDDAQPVINEPVVAKARATRGEQKRTAADVTGPSAVQMDENVEQPKAAGKSRAARKATTQTSAVVDKVVEKKTTRKLKDEPTVAAEPTRATRKKANDTQPASLTVAAHSKSTRGSSKVEASDSKSTTKAKTSKARSQSAEDISEPKDNSEKKTRGRKVKVLENIIEEKEELIAKKTTSRARKQPAKAEETTEAKSLPSTSRGKAATRNAKAETVVAGAPSSDEVVPTLPAAASEEVASTNQPQPTSTMATGKVETVARAPVRRGRRAVSPQPEPKAEEKPKGDRKARSKKKVEVEPEPTTSEQLATVPQSETSKQPAQNVDEPVEDTLDGSSLRNENSELCPSFIQLPKAPEPTVTSKAEPDKIEDAEVDETIVEQDASATITTTQTDSAFSSSANKNEEDKSLLPQATEEALSMEVEEAENDAAQQGLKRKLHFPSEVEPKKARTEEAEPLGDLFTFGEPLAGELGPREFVYKGKKAKRTELARVKLRSKVKQVAVGAYHTVVLTQQGTVITFGVNDDFALGRIISKPAKSNGKHAESNGDQVEDDDEQVDSEEDDDDYEEKMAGKPLRVQGLDAKVIKVTAGDMHSAALCENGHVFIWGNMKDDSDKIGLFVDDVSSQGKDRDATKLPRRIELDNDKKAIDIASGCHHFLILTQDKQVYSFGDGSKGQLGRIHVDDLFSITKERQLFIKPQLVEFASKDARIEKIFARHWCSYALAEDGTLHAWGLNNYYQLGFRTEKLVNIASDDSAIALNNLALELKPTEVSLDTISAIDGGKIVKVANGQQHVLMLDDVGRVYSCGSALYGKLGHGKQFHDNHCGEDKCIDFLKQISADFFDHEFIIDIECGDFCSMAISKEGHLFAWGQGGIHIGTDCDQDRYQPEKVTGLFPSIAHFVRASSAPAYAAIIGVIKDEENGD